MTQTIRPFVILASGALLATAFGLASQPEPREVAAAIKAADVANLPDKADLAAKMIKALGTTPVLHMTVKDLHLGIAYEAQGWMTATKTYCEVRREGKLVFAHAYGDGRVQEFVPTFAFKNGADADRVVLEYNAGATSDEWPRLVDQDFACGPGTIAADSWIKNDHPTVPEMLADNMQADAVLSESTLDGKPCYWFHSVREPGPGMRLTWDLYLDKKTFEPLRQTRVGLQDGKTVKNDVFDYKFEHLKTEAGLTWRIDPSKLK